MPHPSVDDFKSPAKDRWNSPDWVGGRFGQLRIHLLRPGHRWRLGQGFQTVAEPELGGRGVRPEVARIWILLWKEDAESRSGLATEGWPART